MRDQGETIIHSLNICSGQVLISSLCYSEQSKATEFGKRHFVYIVFLAPFAGLHVMFIHSYSPHPFPNSKSSCLIFNRSIGTCYHAQPPVNIWSLTKSGRSSRPCSVLSLICQKSGHTQHFLALNTLQLPMLSPLYGTQRKLASEGMKQTGCIHERVPVLTT